MEDRQRAHETNYLWRYDTGQVEVGQLQTLTTEEAQGTGAPT